MTDDHLKAHLRAVVLELARRRVEPVEDLISELTDEMNEDADDDIAQAMSEALLEGIRWSHRAAVKVTRLGGTMLQFVGPRERLTTEWARRPRKDMDATIRAVWRVVQDGLEEAKDG